MGQAHGTIGCCNNHANVAHCITSSHTHLEDILGLHVHTCELQTCRWGRHHWCSVPAWSNPDCLIHWNMVGRLDQSHRIQIVSCITTSIPTPPALLPPPSIQDTQLQQLHGRDICSLLWAWVHVSDLVCIYIYIYMLYYIYVYIYIYILLIHDVAWCLLFTIWYTYWHTMQFYVVVLPAETIWWSGSHVLLQIDAMLYSSASIWYSLCKVATISCDFDSIL